MTALPKGIVPSVYTGEEVDDLEVLEVGDPSHTWTLSAASGLEAEKGSLTDACTVKVKAASEAEALKKARILVRRNWYRVQEVRSSDMDA